MGDIDAFPREEEERQGQEVRQSAARSRLLTPLSDEEAADLRLVTRKEIETALRGLRGGIQYARYLPGGRYR